MHPMRHFLNLLREDRSVLPRDTTVAEELVDDVLIEMANLTVEQTGVEGKIFVSTAMGQHGPRVKWYAKAGRSQPSFSVSISNEPRVMASSLPERVVNEMAPKVIAWVKLNTADLLNFWHHGDTWSQPDVHAFFQRLKRLPSL